MAIPGLQRYARAVKRSSYILHADSVRQREPSARTVTVKAPVSENKKKHTQKKDKKKKRRKNNNAAVETYGARTIGTH